MSCFYVASRGVMLDDVSCDAFCGVASYTVISSSGVELYNITSFDAM